MTPNLLEFDPTQIPFQYRVLKDIRTKLDYDSGVHEILLSGSVGSAKSILMAHIGITHALQNPGSHVGIGRLSMPALKGTLFQTMCDHIPDKIPHKVVENQAKIFFPKSKITSHSWQDKRYKKVRSYEFNIFMIEELTENDTDAAYKEILMRIGRDKSIKEKFLISATNPDDPSHWVYERFMISNDPRRHVYYSKTKDNPFLPPSYVDDLRKNCSPREALRMLEGQWVELSKDIIYYEYNRDVHFVDDDYQVNPRYPIWWTHDFNIGDGKPMSSVFFQYINDTFHFFAEIVVEGARTLDSCEEAEQRKLFELSHRYIVTGDAAGKHRDTRSKQSDYGIIDDFLNRIEKRIQHEIEVRASNPPIRKRHNIVNAYLKNDLGQHRIKVYKGAPTLDKGFRLTKLKPGGNYIEDDSKPWQHITTAAGYGILKAINYVEGGGGALVR